MTAAELVIPQGWEAITPAWMTAAIRSHHPNAVVDAVRVLLRDDGTNRRARLQLSYASGAGPATVFAKAVDPAHADLVELAEYRAALDLPATELPSSDEVWLRYRASVAHGLAIWIATLSGGDAWQRPDICLAFAQRYAAAFVDLDTRAALDALD